MYGCITVTTPESTQLNSTLSSSSSSSSSLLVVESPHSHGSYSTGQLVPVVGGGVCIYVLGVQWRERDRSTFVASAERGALPVPLASCHSNSLKLTQLR